MHTSEVDHHVVAALRVRRGMAPPTAEVRRPSRVSEIEVARASAARRELRAQRD